MRSAEVRANDLGGWSAICPAHGVVGGSSSRVLAQLASDVHDGLCGGDR